MKKFGLIVVLLFAWSAGAGAVTCPSSITGTITPTSCWPISEGSGTTITDTQGAANTGTLSGSYTWESNNDLLCNNSAGSGCNITTTTTYNNPQPVTIVFSFAGTSGPILQLGSSSSTSATTQYYLAYLDRLGRLTFGVNNYGNMSVLQSSLSYADGNQHIAAVAISPTNPSNPGGMRMTIDGVTVASRNVQLANYANGAQWFIGGANATIWPDGPSASYFNGTIYYVAWLNGTAATDAQAQAMTGTSVAPISGVPLTTLTGTVGSISDVTGFAPPPGTSVYFQISGIQRPGTGDFIIAPTPQTKACIINSSGNLTGPTGLYANCQLPQGAHVTMTIGTGGQPIQLIIPFQSTVDLATLILAQSDPASIVNNIAVAGPYGVGVTVTNPATGQIGTSTITWPQCNKVTVSTGTYNLDTSTATCQVVTLAASSTITLTNLIDSQIDYVYVVQNGTGGWTPTFAAPGGDTLTWVNGLGATQPDMPTTAANSITLYKFDLNGTAITGDSKYIDKFPSGTLTMGGVGTGSAKFKLNGTTSGTQTWAIPDAAGTFTYTFPSAQGGVGTQLQNDGSGTLSWAGANNSGTSLSFGGALTTGVAVTGSTGVNGLNVMKATRALTVDSCYTVFPALGGSCSPFPQIEIVDQTASQTICAATGDNVGTGSGGSSLSVAHSSISSGDVVTAAVLTAEGGTCTKAMFAIGMTYH